jgi:hypothetical protein
MTADAPLDSIVALLTTLVRTPSRADEDDLAPVARCIARGLPTGVCRCKRCRARTASHWACTPSAAAATLGGPGWCWTPRWTPPVSATRRPGPTRRPRGVSTGLAARPRQRRLEGRCGLVRAPAGQPGAGGPPRHGRTTGRVVRPGRTQRRLRRCARLLRPAAGRRTAPAAGHRRHRLPGRRRHRHRRPRFPARAAAGGRTGCPFRRHQPARPERDRPRDRTGPGTEHAAAARPRCAAGPAAPADDDRH